MPLLSHVSIEEFYGSGTFAFICFRRKDVLAKKKSQKRAIVVSGFVALIANAFEADKKKAMECGMNGYIFKPINVEVLVKTLRTVLG